MRRLLSFLSLGLGITFAADAQRWHKMPTQAEIDYRQAHPKNGVTFSKKGTTSTGIMPADARFPGEFEETQAVLVSWPYDGWDIDVTSTYADLWAQMSDAIQQEAKLIIRVDNYSDSTAIKNFMASKGTPLTNYRFSALLGDAWWTRDFGPLGFYYSGEDSVGFLDIHYYPGRDNDDAYAEFLGDEFNYKNVKTNLHAEGGNFMTDGHKRFFHSSVISTVNTYSPPLYPGWTAQQIKDSVKYYWAADTVTVTPRLQCDGGTGHIDMYMKMMDDETFAIMEYPSTVTAGDKNIINNVINTLSGKKSIYDRPYRIFKMPMPTNDAGTHPSLCGQINSDARTFVNGLLVNKTYLMPAFSDDNSGNKAGDSAAIALLKKIIPGYNIVPIDARNLTILGGAIHCVTMQIPAENPIRFWHPAYTDFQPLQNSYYIVARITNKSGISKAECNWRLKGQTNWNTVSLTDSAGYWVGQLASNFIHYDEVEYYLSATSNNGKTMNRPMVAPEGFYTFKFNFPTSVNTLDPDQNFALNPAPNPSNGQFFIPVGLELPRTVRAVVTDILGKQIASQDFGKLGQGISKLDFDLSNQPAGMYFLQITADNLLLSTKKVVIE